LESHSGHERAQPMTCTMQTERDPASVGNAFKVPAVS
jgi:hypothetical protein